MCRLTSRPLFRFHLSFQRQKQPHLVWEYGVDEFTLPWYFTVNTYLVPIMLQAVYCHPALFNFYAEYIMRNTGLEEAQASLPGEISITSDMQITPPLWQKVKRN